MPGYRWDFYRSTSVDLFVLAQVVDPQTAQAILALLTSSG
mgnify:CR=1 FL=1